MISLRPLLAAAGRPSVPAASATLRARLARGLSVACLAACACLPVAAFAASGERIGSGSLPGGKADGESLTYDNFTNFNCAQTGFFTNATAHLNIAGDVVLHGTTTLDGVPYDTYLLSVLGGPDNFTTNFSRDFAPPPPASSTYTFVFTSVVWGAHRFGSSITTITCNGGAFSAQNVWIPEPAPIPAGGPAGWAALALLLAAAAAVRLAPRRA